MTKILLVEDDKSLREIYGVRLLAEGYDIVSAGDGEEALATAIKEKPDLIVSDVMMPKISGFDMLDILRSTPDTKDIKVIMMTALSSDDQRDRGEKLGADRYLVKSQVGIEDVVRTVHEVLGDAPIVAPQFSSMQSQQQPQQQPQTQAPAPQAMPSEPEPEQLPQPTAPFSSPRPATLGERIIHPIESEPPHNSGENEISLADRISAELEQANSQGAPAPQAQPEQMQQSQQAPQMQPTAPQPQMQQEQPQMQQPVQQAEAQPDFQMPQPQTQPQQFVQPQQQEQPIPQPIQVQQQAPAPQPEMQMQQPHQQPQTQPTAPQPQMQQEQPQMQQPVQQAEAQPLQQQQAPAESPQPLQIDPNAVGNGRSFNVPPRQ